MPRSGRRHRLVLYTYLLNRWWRALLAIGVALLILAGGLGGLPLLLPQYPFLWVSDWKLWFLGGVGGLAILLAVFLAAIRRSAYVQPFENHLRLATPFLRVDISYRRFRRTYADEFQHLFPLKKYKAWARELLEPLAGRTVLVLELTGFPVPRWTLRLFLSPFFFPDRTPRLALLVSDWIALSTEVDSFRGLYQDARRPAPEPPPAASLLSSLKKPPE